MTQKGGTRTPHKSRESRSLPNVSFVKSAETLSQLPEDGRPEVAFIGRSNVGKSSLVNLLTGRKSLAKSSSTPGKTRTFNYYSVDNSWYLVDLPGFGYAKMSRVQRERWARVIVDYLERREALRLVVHLIDSRHTPGQIDQSVFEMMSGGWVPYIVVLTKTDKLSGNERSKSLARVKAQLDARGMENAIIMTSTKDQRGKAELIEWIESLAR